MTNKDKIIELVEKEFNRQLDYIKTISDEEFAERLKTRNGLTVKIDVTDCARILWYFYKEKFGMPSNLDKFWFEEFIDVGADY